MTRLTYGSILVAVLLAAGCQQASQVAPPPPPPPKPEPVPEVVRPTPPPPPPRVEAPVELARLIYFDFDRSDIRPEYRDLVSEHASLLADSPGQKVRLEGHADERGSREYNIGLGERRAQAVRQAMMLRGVQSSQIQTLSYGEERPQDPGKGEFAWSKNRRVEIISAP